MPRRVHILNCKKSVREVIDQSHVVPLLFLCIYLKTIFNLIQFTGKKLFVVVMHCKDPVDIAHDIRENACLRGSAVHEASDSDLDETLRFSEWDQTSHRSAGIAVTQIAFPAARAELTGRQWSSGINLTNRRLSAY